MQACAVVGCEINAGRIVTGYCITHYQRMKKHGDPGPPGRLRDWNADRVCSIDGCPRSSLRRGMCQLHYHRVRKYGDPYFIKLGHDVSLTPREQAGCRRCGASLAGMKANAVYCSRSCKGAAGSARRDKRNPWRTNARRVKRAGDGYYVFGERDWRRLCARFDNRCAYCGNRAPLTLDHVVPVSRGGTHGIGNVLPACVSCNCSKGAKLLVEWRRR